MDMYKFTGIVLLIIVYMLRDSGLVDPSPIVIGLAWFNFAIDSVHEIMDRMAIRRELINGLYANQEDDDNQ